MSFSKSYKEYISDNVSNILTYPRREKTYTAWDCENCQQVTIGKERDRGKNLCNLVIIECQGWFSGFSDYRLSRVI